jgi:hypothetical protein
MYGDNRVVLLVCIYEKKCRIVWFLDDNYDKEHWAHHIADLGKLLIFILLTPLVLFHWIWYNIMCMYLLVGS